MTGAEVDYRTFRPVRHLIAKGVSDRQAGQSGWSYGGSYCLDLTQKTRSRLDGRSWSDNMYRVFEQGTTSSATLEAYFGGHRGMTQSPTGKVRNGFYQASQNAHLNLARRSACGARRARRRSCIGSSEAPHPGRAGLFPRETHGLQEHRNRWHRCAANYSCSKYCWGVEVRSRTTRTGGGRKGACAENE